MNTIGTYLLQMSSWLAAFWLIYVLLLKKETYFTLNRWFLNAGLVAAVLMPLVPVSYKVYRTLSPLPVTLMQTAQVTAVEDIPAGINYWLVAYLIGAIFFVVRLVYQHVQLYRIRKRSVSQSLGSIKVFRIERETAPFSFFNHIYVSSKTSSEVELNTIVAHEKVHIHERHWADLLLLEVVRTLQWFNPLMQLYRKAMMQNHEYLADSGTLEHGVSERTYRAVLANQMLGIPVVSFANSFTFINSSKRLLMMKKDKSTPKKRLKLLLILPLMAVIVMGFARPKYVFNEIPSTAPSETTSITKGKVFDMYGKLVEGVVVSSISSGTSTTSNENGEFTLNGIKDKDDISAKKDGYSYANTIVGDSTLIVLMSIPKGQPQQTMKIKGKVMDENGEPLPGASIVVSHSTYGTVSDMKGEFILYDVKPSDNIVVSFVGYQTVVLPAKKDMTFKMDRAVISIGVDKTEMAPPPPPPPADLDIRSDNGGKPLVIVDGVPSNGDEWKAISPDKIQSISVLKDPSATAVYGYKGKEGVILISTKEYPKLMQSLGSLEKPLVVLNGKITSLDVNEIDPATIQSINVIKDQSAIDKYGEKAKNGVAEISTKIITEHEPEPTNGEVFVIVEDMPEYPGGAGALANYIQKSTAGSKESGTVYVAFVVDGKGKVGNAKVAKSTNEKLNEKALKIVNAMQDWKPGKQRGKPVKVDYTIPIKFGSDDSGAIPANNKSDDAKLVSTTTIDEQMPEYPGGLDAFSSFILEKTSHINDKGKYAIQFKVDKKGKVLDLKIVESASDSFNSVLAALIKDMPIWAPAKQNGAIHESLVQFDWDADSGCLAYRYKII